MSYGEIYRIKYKDHILEGTIGRETIIKILRKDYAGDWSYLIGAADPLFISAKTDSDYLFDQICGSSAKINVISEYSFQFLDLFSANSKYHKIEVWKEETPGGESKLFWTGFVVPDNYNEPLHYYENYPVSIQAIDGLARLQDADFLKTDKTFYSGYWSLNDLMIELLSKTGLDLPITYAFSWDEIYTGITGWNCPFGKLYVNMDTLYFSKTPKCDYVLKQILQAFGARIVQNKGRWIIKEVTKNASSHVVHKSEGGTETVNPVKSYSRERNLSRLVFVDHAGDLNIDPAYKEFSIHHDFLKKKMLLQNGDFEQFSIVDKKLVLPGWFINPANADFWYTRRTFTCELALNGIFGSHNYSEYVQSFPIDISLDNRQTYFSIDIKKNHFHSELEIKIGNQWVNNLGEFQGTSYRHSLDPANAVNDFVKFELNIEASNISGPLVIRIYRPWFGGTPNQTTRPFFYVDNIIFKYKDSETKEDINFEVTVDEDNNYIPETIESIFGDLPEVKDREDIYLGTFYRYVVLSRDSFGKVFQDAYIPTLKWRNSTGQEETILQLLAELINDTYIRPKQYLTGLKLKGNFDFDSSLQVNFLDNRIYLPIHFEFNDKKCEWTIDCIEVLGDKVLANEEGDYIVTHELDYIKV